MENNIDINITTNTEIEKYVGKSIEKVTDTSVNGISNFLGKICMPVANEFGLFLQDKVKIWRIKNIENILNKTQQILKIQERLNDSIQAHPLLVSKIIENSSWSTEDDIQNMWAGLLSSTCTEDGKDDSNLIFVNILSQMTSIEVKLLNFICEKSPLEVDSANLVTGNYFKTTKQELCKICKTNDIHRIDRELDHLNTLGLIDGSFGYDENDNEIDPSIAYLSAEALGIHLYVRCQGTLKSPAEYFNI
jgi:hypothetical protein